MAKVMKGKPVADAICEKLVPKIEECLQNGIKAKLAVVRVGERDDDLSYERSIEKRFGNIGIEIEKFILPSDCSQLELMSTIETVNGDDSIHGCLMFRPLPPHLDEAAACEALKPEKDVDGITRGSLYGVFANQPVGFPPCTADACMEMLKYYDFDLTGANAVVLGRSLVIGKPVAMMLLAANATVTTVHTKSQNIEELCSKADVLVAAVGHRNTVGANAVRKGQVVIDVGINWDESAGKLCGDVDFDAVESIVDAITPVPGGVGSVTTAVLAKHVVQAASQ